MSAYAVSARGLVSRRIPQGVLAPMNALLFGSGEQGAWYDPSDLSTLFQDAAGTTPVTAMEQFVGRMLDKSGNGNHASQATSPKRGVVSRRVNLLTKTEQFDDAAWVKDSADVSSTFVQAPDGSITAQRIVPNTSVTTTHRIRQSVPGVVPANAGVCRLYIKSAGLPWAKLRAGSAYANINLNTGVVGYSSNAVITKLSAEPNGFWFIEVRPLVTIGGQFFYAYPATVNSSSLDETAFAGDGTSGIDVWRPSVTLATDANLPYQWVNTATDYDADPNKFPTYIRLDGSDDAYQTNSIVFTGTDKMTVWAGITKLSDAARGVVLELSVSAGANNGVFQMEAPSTGLNEFFWGSKGTVLSTAISVASAPASRIVTGIGDISGDIASLRVNGVATTASANQGTGNYGNYPLFIGGRAGASLFFNGRLYSLIVRGAQSSLSQLEAGELLTKSRMKLP